MSSFRRGRSSGGDGFPHQSQLEQLFDEDFSNVDVKTGESANLHAIGAGGLAGDEQIAIPNSTPTLELMAHELAHIKQQRQGTTPTSLTSVPNDSAETEAKNAEAQAARGEAISISAQPTGMLQGDWGMGALIGGAIGSVAGPGGAILGGMVGGMIQDALTDDEEEAPAPAPAPTPETPAPAPTPEPDVIPEGPVTRPVNRVHTEARADFPTRAQAAAHFRNQRLGAADTQRRLAGYDVRMQHYNQDLDYTDPNQVVSLDSPEARARALNDLTQNHMHGLAGHDESQEMCGATSLMAAVMMGGGFEGVGNLATSLGSAEGLDEDTRAQFAAIAERAQTNQLTHADIQALTHRMHTQMDQYDRDRGDPDTYGVSDQAMQNMIGSNSAISDAMRAGNMRRIQVDTEGDGRGNHWIMHMGQGTANEAYYDPMARVDGTQLVNSTAGKNTYSNATHSH